MADPTEHVVVPAKAAEPAIDLIVNFGVVTGRRATKAEIERLAATLLERAPAVTISIVERYEVTAHSRACLEQVHVAVGSEAADESGFEFDVLNELVTALARTWALECRELPPEGDLSLAERLAPRTVSVP